MAARSMEAERGLALSSLPPTSLDNFLSGGGASDRLIGGASARLVGGEWTRGGVGGSEV